MRLDVPLPQASSPRLTGRPSCPLPVGPSPLEGRVAAVEQTNCSLLEEVVWLHGKLILYNMCIIRALVLLHACSMLLAYVDNYI